jgi:hypothetical protein
MTRASCQGFSVFEDFQHGEWSLSVPGAGTESGAQLGML